MSKLLLKIHDKIANRAEVRLARAERLQELLPLQKQAFDSRRTNSYTEYNPRRNLQYYHRSDPFISKPTAEVIKNFFKLKTAVDAIKEDYLGDPDYFDSYARILSNALDRTLRVEAADFDYSIPQMDYLKELLYLRYRLQEEDLKKLSEKELKTIILDRDEKLAYKSIYAHYNNGGLQKNSSPATAPVANTKDTLIESLFGQVKASKDSPDITRSVTITINDKINPDISKIG